jgi:type VI secretion system Hcp family effector
MKSFAWIAAVVLLALFAQVARADEMYATIDNVQGGATAAAHQKQIQVNGFSLTVTAPPVENVREPGQSKTTFNLTLAVDISASKLFELASSHSAIKSIQVDVFATGQDGREKKILTIMLTNAVITTYELHTDPTKVGAQAATPTVDLGLLAEKIEISQ